MEFKFIVAAAAAKSFQSCPTLCDPTDSSPQGSPVPGILQARTLEWVAISFSNAWKWKVKVKSLSHAQLLATPWTAAYQPPPSMGFSRQEHWSGVPLPSPKFTVRHIYLVSFLWPDLRGLQDLSPWPGIEPGPLAAKGKSPNHWTTREFPWNFNFKYIQTAIHAVVNNLLFMVFRT